MSYYIVGLLTFLILAIAYLLSRLLTNKQCDSSEPVTESEYERQYLDLMDGIRALEEKLNKHPASKRLQLQLETKRQQAKYLQSLMVPTFPDEVPDIYQTAEEFNRVQSWLAWRSSHTEAYLCPNCNISVQAGDKFCARCGRPLQEKPRN